MPAALPAQGQRLGLRLLANHVLWGVGVGGLLSLSTLGPRFLNPGTPPNMPNCSYAVGAGFVYLLLDYFARTTEPVAFFATGMWMVRARPVAVGWLAAAAYMAVKLVLVPALMVACCFTVGLEGADARAAVLVATLPVSAGERRQLADAGGPTATAAAAGSLHARRHAHLGLAAAFVLSKTYGVGEDVAGERGCSWGCGRAPRHATPGASPGRSRQRVSG